MPFHQVYTAGHGAGGRLGLNDTNPRNKFVGPLGSLENVVIRGLRCRSKHALAITKEGEVVSWGYNQFGQTGHGPQTISDWEPRIIKGLEGTRILQIETGEDHSLALSDCGEVFSWGRGISGQLGHGDVKDLYFPFLVRSLQGKGIRSIGAGHNHSFAVTATGKVFAFGSSSSGQLGNGEVDGSVGGNVYLPIPIKALEGKNIVQATGGRNFSMFLTADGELHSVGYASNGQLGVKLEVVEELETSYSAAVRKVELQGSVIMEVSCGDSHCIAVSSSGAVFSWGNGMDWALGHGDQNHVYTPKAISMLDSDICIHGCAGGHHSMAVTHDGKLFVWGRDFIGQLGLGRDLSATHIQGYEPLPTKVKFSKDADGAELAVLIAAGQCHSILVTSLGKESEPVVAPVVKPVSEPEITVAPAAPPPKPAVQPATQTVAGRGKKEERKRHFLTLVVEIISGRNVLAKDKRGTSDPYCKVSIKEGRQKQKERTKVMPKTCDPVWNERFVFVDCCNRIAVEGDPTMAQPGVAPEVNWDLKLKVSCMDADLMGADENLGVLYVPLAGLGIGRKRDIWVPLSPKIEGQVVQGDIRLRLLLTDKPLDL